MVIEHDLAVLDFLADNVYLVFGSEGAYGAFAQPRQVRQAINVYLDGYAKEENIRFRDTPSASSATRLARLCHRSELLEYPELDCDIPAFKMKVEAGASRSARRWGWSAPTPSARPHSLRCWLGYRRRPAGRSPGGEGLL